MLRELFERADKWLFGPTMETAENVAEMMQVITGDYAWRFQGQSAVLECAPGDETIRAIYRMIYPAGLVPKKVGDKTKPEEILDIQKTESGEIETQTYVSGDPLVPHSYLVVQIQTIKEFPEQARGFMSFLSGDFLGSEDEKDEVPIKKIVVTVATDLAMAYLRSCARIMQVACGSTDLNKFGTNSRSIL